MTAPADTPAPGERPPDTRPPISEDWLARFRGRPEFLSRLFEVFLAEEPRRIAKLDAAVAAGDLETVNFLAHSLKGAAATMGMERLSDAARKLEQAAKDGGTADLADLLAQVEREVQAVFAVVRAF